MHGKKSTGECGNRYNVNPRKLPKVNYMPNILNIVKLICFNCLLYFTPVHHPQSFYETFAAPNSGSWVEKTAIYDHETIGYNGFIVYDIHTFCYETNAPCNSDIVGDHNLKNFLS